MMTRRRSLAKAVTWRVLATATTFAVSLIVTGSMAVAGSISAIEVVVKIVLYYAHERVWHRQRGF